MHEGYTNYKKFFICNKHMQRHDEECEHEANTLHPKH